MAKLSDYYGILTFNKKVMGEKLSKQAYKELLEVIEQGGKLAPDLANQVAHAMKEWALEHGATHFTHWFQPQRGVTAEKHDSFLTFLDNGEVVERFSGQQLIQSEPDASSFPSGGMRSTFEARGYTAWDPTSPAFLLKSEKTATLVIPSVFLSYTGVVLDLKTPFLRSLSAVEKSAYKLLKLFGNRTAKFVRTTAGPEQEYFLIDKRFFEKRPDLVFTGRTLIGAASAKHQQLEDHYFGSIKPKVLNFMEEVDRALFERGIPTKTRHNEVAPNQFEIAPLYEEANLAIDHNLQTMEIMRTIADKHGFSILFHEKPFAGINGSGKHLNWSLEDSEGNNLLEPGKNPKKNMQFLAFLSAILLGVDKYGGLLRMAVADAGNDHRLGANEAPPAIMSVFLGDYLSRLMDEISKGNIGPDLVGGSIDLKVDRLPDVKLDNTDRNRTSPIAFTGNKFEFRAVGSSQNCAEPACVMNLLVAYGLDEISSRMEKYIEKGKEPKEAALEVIKEVVGETQKIRFEGNNYSADWHKEAEKRGLPAAKNTPEALHLMVQKDTIGLFEKYEVLTKAELHSKYEIKLEAYIKVKKMELHIIEELTKQYIIPSLTKQIIEYGQGVNVLKSTSIGGKVLDKYLSGLQDNLDGIDSDLIKIEALLAKTHDSKNFMEEALLLGSEGVALLDSLRRHCDNAEKSVDSKYWMLPKYGEMLFLI